VAVQLRGYGMSADAHHITQPPEDGAGAALAMERALENAGALPGQVLYINAHGTSTPLGDVAELRAIHRVFGASGPRNQHEEHHRVSTANQQSTLLTPCMECLVERGKCEGYQKLLGLIQQR
jgi:3-oxoacyl-(acyl-carrier-protein) synthase